MTESSRRVTANLGLTIDGRYSEMGAIVPYAVTDVAREHLARIWNGATTAVLGRRNAEGFLGFWPPVATTRTPTRGTAATRSGWWTRRRWSFRAP
jgi:hypothetical protein